MTLGKKYITRNTLKSEQANNIYVCSIYTSKFKEGCEETQTKNTAINK